MEIYFETFIDLRRNLVLGWAYN